MSKQSYSAKEYYLSTKTNVDPIRHKVLIPAVLSLIGDAYDKSVADVGCGPGMLIENLLKLKPKTIEAFDISNEMLKLFNSKYSSIQSSQLDITNTSLPKNKFDIILSILVLHTIQNIDHAVSNLVDGLLHNGELVICIPHPCFHYKQEQINSISNPIIPYDEPLSSNSYHIKNKLINFFGQPQVKVEMHHRPISFYVNTLVDNGLVVTDLKEPKSNDVDPWDSIPPFLLIKAKKLCRE